jgi:hypothetical protein
VKIDLELHGEGIRAKPGGGDGNTLDDLPPCG